MASRLAVAAVVLLAAVAGADALRQQGGGNPAPPAAEPEPVRVVAPPVPPPHCTRTRSRSVVVVRCDHWKGYPTGRIVLTSSSRELGPR